MISKAKKTRTVHRASDMEGKVCNTIGLRDHRQLCTRETGMERGASKSEFKNLIIEEQDEHYERRG